MTLSDQPAGKAIIDQLVHVGPAYELARVTAIVGPDPSRVVAAILGVPAPPPNDRAVTLDHLRHVYRDCRRTTAEGVRTLTDDELFALHDEGARRRWVAVEFLTPNADGTPRVGLFTSFRLAPPC